MKAGVAYAQWLGKMRRHWGEIAIERVEVTPDKIKVDEEIQVRAWVNLGSLSPDDVTVQLYYGPMDTRGEIVAGETLDMTHCCPAPSKDGVHEFAQKLRYTTTGKRGISVRVLPYHPDLPNPLLTNLITWPPEELQFGS